MTPVRNALGVAVPALAVLLTLLAGTAGIGRGAALVGLGCGLVLAIAAARTASRERVELLGPADLVTVTRAALACCVAALVADSWSGGSAVGLLVALASLALVLDAVDGRVARRTGTVSRFGGRLDGEADAFLMLVLSVYVAESDGAWVLAMGAARYLFAVAGWWLPWMRATLPARPWRKVVTATAGIALTFAASGLGPAAATYAGLVLGFLLLAESFGRDVWWLWRRRRSVRPEPGRAAYDDALRRARTAAYPPGDFVGQESFMSGREILSVARTAGVRPGASVLDLCCGVAGPGRLITGALGCVYLGVDQRPDAIEVARARSTDPRCRFEVGEVPPLRPGTFDVVLLLETLLAFPDKEALLQEVSSALVPGGRFVITVEEGRPLTDRERRDMPGGETVWPVPLAELVSMLAAVGLQVRWVRECTREHRLVADALVEAFEADRSAISAAVGADVVDRLLVSHRLWSAWMAGGRVRKFAVVAHRVDGGGVAC